MEALRSAVELDQQFIQVCVRCRVFGVSHARVAGRAGAPRPRALSKGSRLPPAHSRTNQSCRTSLCDCGLAAQYYESVRIRAAALPRLQRVRVQLWLAKLEEPTTNLVWKRNRNAYVRLLHQQLAMGVLEAPFDVTPPGTSLPTLQPWQMYRQETAIG
jgi:hypothetical protein